MQTSYSPHFFVEGDLFLDVVVVVVVVKHKKCKKKTKLWVNNLHGVETGTNNYKKREKHARGKTIVTQNKKKSLTKQTKLKSR